MLPTPTKLLSVAAESTSSCTYSLVSLSQRLLRILHYYLFRTSAQFSARVLRRVQCPHLGLGGASTAHLHARTPLDFGTGRLWSHFCCQLVGMEIIKEQPLTRLWPYEISEVGVHYRSIDLKDKTEPLLAARLPTGSYSGTSTHVSLVHDAMSHVHFSLCDKERYSASSEASSHYNAAASKLSKNGWILSTSEVLNGQNGCYLLGSNTCSSEITDDHLLHSCSSVHSICDELVHSNRKPSLSPSASSLAFSDGSPATEGIGSTEGNHPDPLKDDFIYELGFLGDWPADVADLSFANPDTPQNMSHTANSGNSSGGSSEDRVGLYGQDDLSLTNLQKEYEAVSCSRLDTMEQVPSLEGVASWVNHKRFDGLEEMFTPAKRAREEIGSSDGAIPLPAGGSHNTQLSDLPPHSSKHILENRWQEPLPGRVGTSVDDGVFLINLSNKRGKYEGEVHSEVFRESASKFNDQSSSENIGNNKFKDNIASQTPGPISLVHNEIQIQPDTTGDFGLNPVLDTSLGTGRSEDYSEICLVHLLIAGAEAVATRYMDLASVILVRLKELVSFSGSTMQRVAAYFSDGLQSRIEGNHQLTRIGSNKSQSDLLAAFQILHEISPYIKFGHFTANQALLEAMEGEKSVHIVDFEIMEGIQWPPFMQALVSRKGGPPHLRITALYRPHAERGLAAVQETGKRLDSFAASLNLPFTFNVVRVNNEEEFSVSSIKLIKGEALAVNCMLNLPHMPRRTATSVTSFLQGMRKLSPTVMTLVEEELGCSAMAVASYFFEALHHYSAICDSLEACLSSETVARMLVERVFLAPRINSTVMFWSGSSAQREIGTEFATYNWCSLVRSVGFKSLPLSFQNHSQARLLLGLYKDGFKLEERSNRLLLGWRAKPLFAASVWN